MVVFSGLTCRKCGTRVALAVTPGGKTFRCPTCRRPMRARRRVVTSALAWCGECWTASEDTKTHICPRCHRPLEPIGLALLPSAVRAAR